MGYYSSGCALSDSTRTTTVAGSTCTDFSTESDLTSEFSSVHELRGSLTDYQLHRLIGRGKYSQVYLATHIPTQSYVAVKKVQIFDMMEPKARLECLKEVKVLQSLDHSNIVKWHTSFIQDNELIIVLEWAEAGDLGNILKQRSEQGQYFSSEHVWDLFKQICSALKHMHERRMMHRDLKPSNVFVKADGTLKLGDLGLSRYFSSGTLLAHTIVGTPYYMSPECIRGEPYNFSSDIWSLGCLLYELIALRNPFYKENQTLYMLGKNITSCNYDPLPLDTPQGLKDLVSAMLQQSPQSRPSINQVQQFVVASLSGAPPPSLHKAQGTTAMQPDLMQQ